MLSQLGNFRSCCKTKFQRFKSNFSQELNKILFKNRKFLAISRDISRYTFDFRHISSMASSSWSWSKRSRIRVLTTSCGSFLTRVFVSNSIFHREEMAEGEEKLTGLTKYFNSQTMYGRANVSDLTSKSSSSTKFSFILEWIFECSINFPGDEGDIRRYRTDRFVLLLETEEQKNVVHGWDCSYIM